MLNRRDFVAGSAGGLLVLATGEVETIMAASGKKSGPARVALVKNLDRFTAVPANRSLFFTNGRLT